MKEYDLKISNILYMMSSAEVLVITESETYEFDIGNYSTEYVERAVKSYERRQETSRAYYARMKDDPEWKQKRREQAKARRLKKKKEIEFISSPSS